MKLPYMYFTVYSAEQLNFCGLIYPHFGQRLAKVSYCKSAVVAPLLVAGVNNTLLGV